jgi:hypothetical protein
MNDHPEDPLDQLLQEHLRRRLDPQLGRAESDFLQKVTSARHGAQAHPHRLLIWGVWAAGAMAASVGIVWGVAVHRAPPMPAISQHPTPRQPPAPSALASIEIPIEQVLSYRTLDEGTAVLENVGPVRQLRRQVMETVQWYDPQAKANVQITVPREEVVYVAMPSY